MLDWMDKTHKTLQITPFMAFSTIQASHGYNHKAGEIIELPEYVSHQNFKQLQLETDIHEKSSWQNSLCSAYTEIQLC